jgi:hypothetical protein
LATGCGGGGGSSAAVVPVPANRPGFDLAKDVHPFDPALVKHWPGLPNVGTSCYVNAGIRLAFTEPRTFPSGQPTHDHDRVQTFPTLVPNHLVMEFNHHLGPTRALPFSEKVALATYAVDRAQGTETRQSDVPMRALAAAVYRPDHFWAVIRGEDGWYENNDAAPSTRVPPTHLDGLANPNGDLTRNLELVLYQRSDS